MSQKYIKKWQKTDIAQLLNLVISFLFLNDLVTQISKVKKIIKYVYPLKRYNLFEIWILLLKIALKG